MTAFSSIVVEFARHKKWNIILCSYLLHFINIFIIFIILFCLVGRLRKHSEFLFFLVEPFGSVLFKCGISDKNWINIVWDCSYKWAPAPFLSLFRNISIIDFTRRHTFFPSSENKGPEIQRAPVPCQNHLKLHLIKTVCLLPFRQTVVQHCFQHPGENIIIHLRHWVSALWYIGIILWKISTCNLS